MLWHQSKAQASARRARLSQRYERADSAGGPASLDTVTESSFVPRRNDPATSNAAGCFQFLPDHTGGPTGRPLRLSEHPLNAQTKRVAAAGVVSRTKLRRNSVLNATAT